MRPATDPAVGEVAARRCRICGGAVEFAFTTIDRNRRLSAERFDYVRCRVCETLALANVPGDLSRYYPPDYYRVPQSRQQLLAATGDVERAKLGLVRACVPGGRLLEIGPGVGAFLACALEAGYDAAAVEMDEGCCGFLSRELGVATTCSADPASALTELGEFDVITLWQVIEHLTDPRGIVAAAARALAPGGVLAISAPNPEAFQIRLFGARWTHVDAPRHLFLLPVRVVVQMAQAEGLVLAVETTSDASARNWNAFGWRESLAGTTVRPRARLALRVAGSVIARAAAPVERGDRRGATYTVLLRRPAR